MLQYSQLLIIEKNDIITTELQLVVLFPTKHRMV